MDYWDRPAARPHRARAMSPASNRTTDRSRPSSRLSMRAMAVSGALEVTANAESRQERQARDRRRLREVVVVLHRLDRAIVVDILNVEIERELPFIEGP